MQMNKLQKTTLNTITKNGILYFKDYKTTRIIKNRLQETHPNTKIRKYELGFAIQYYDSGPYYPELEN